MDKMIWSTKELERTTCATYALITYYNYIEAWVVCIEGLYGSDHDGESAFVKQFRSSDAFNHVQGGASVANEFYSAYFRGRLTFRAINNLPIEQYPELALSANFWLPVQSYYAIHGVGLATMIALKRGSPKTHRSFRGDFSELVNKYFPCPFCGRCIGGPDLKDFSFQNLNTSLDKVTKQSQLANPRFTQEIESFIGKSLSTTRKKSLEVRFDEIRKDKGGRRLASREKKECCQKEHATSVCDLLYRMRIRSNYDNPDMYLFVPDDLDSATQHYRDLRYLTRILIAGLDALIEQRVGKIEMSQLRSKFRAS